MNKLKLNIIFLVLALSACHPRLSSDVSSPNVQEQQEWPTYQEHELSGKIFGETWLAKSAIARADINNPNDLVIEIYAEDKPMSCEGISTNNKSYMTVHIPKNYSKAEYKYNMKNLSQSGNPIVFTSTGATIRNLITERTSVRIDSINNQGFNASLTADGFDELGTLSEINGQISVTDCTKVVAFSVWEKLIDGYKLYSFDGVAQDLRYSHIELDQNNIYDRTSLSYKKSLILPLYYSISANSDATYQFGPIDGLGVSEVNQNGQQTIYTYKMDGLINFKGMDMTLKLDLMLIKYFDEIEVRYTIEIPNHVQKTSHKFTLKK